MTWYRPRLVDGRRSRGSHGHRLPGSSQEHQRGSLAWTSPRAGVRPAMLVIARDHLAISYDLYKEPRSHSTPPPSVKRSPDRLTRASEGRRVGRSGRTRASRGDTHIMSLQAPQLHPWRARGMGGPASRGSLLVAPRPPAYSPQAPPPGKQEVSRHPRVRTRPGKVHVEGASARSWEAVPQQRLF